MDYGMGGVGNTFVSASWSLPSPALRPRAAAAAPAPPPPRAALGSPPLSTVASSRDEALSTGAARRCQSGRGVASALEARRGSEVK